MTSYPRPVPAVLSHIMKCVVVAMAGVLAFESLMPAAEAVSLNNIDKVVHAVAYFGLAYCIAAGWRKSSLWFVFFVSAAFGAAMEAGQGLMDMGRSASPWDQLANTVGAAFACLAWVMLIKIYRRFWAGS